MNHVRRITPLLALLAITTLACQTVMNLVQPGTPTIPPVPTLAAVPTLAPEPTQPQQGEPTQPSGQGQPTLPVALPTQLQGLGTGAKLSSPADTKTALSGSNPPKALEALATEQYTDTQLQQMNHTFPYTVQLTGEQPVLWWWGWCATTQDILNQNLQHITVAFSMNGLPVPLDQFYAYDSQVTDAQGNTLPCHSWATVASGWPPAVALQTVVTFDAKINDGMNDYPAGNQTFVYAVTLP